MQANKMKLRALTAGITLFGSLVGGANAAAVITDGILSSSLTASNSYLAQTPDKAFDSNTSTAWNAGSSSGWIEMDLGAIFSVSGANVRVAMSPNGGATHQFYVSNTPIANNIAGVTLAHTLSGYFTHHQVSTPTFATEVEGRYVQIRTTSAPAASWVSWFEVGIMGNPVPEPSSIALLGLGSLALMLRRRR